jgi:multidrug efflux pump subunit AcrB
MWLTRLFIRRPTLVFVLVALTLIAAVMALRTLVVQEQPNNGLPSISISVAYSGASTTELQSEIAQPIEDQLAGTPYLVTQSTTIESGQVNISASFSLQSTDTENIANVEKALQAAQKQLPSTITPPTIRVADPSEPTVVTLALLSKKYPSSVLGAIANQSVVPVIQQLAGVSNVNVAGTTQPAYMVTVDPNLLAADNLTLGDVVGSITPNNIRAPGGYVYQPGRETQLDVRGDRRRRRSPTFPFTSPIAARPMRAPPVLRGLSVLRPEARCRRPACRAFRWADRRRRRYRRDRNRCRRTSRSARPAATARVTVRRRAEARRAPARSRRRPAADRAARRPRRARAAPSEARRAPLCPSISR